MGLPLGIAGSPHVFTASLKRDAKGPLVKGGLSPPLGDDWWIPFRGETLGRRRACGRLIAAPTGGYSWRPVNM